MQYTTKELKWSFNISEDSVQNTYVLYMFYTVHCSIIINENQAKCKNYIFSQFIPSTYFGQFLAIIRVLCYRVQEFNNNLCVFVQGIFIYKYR
jgi:hypothetical protein